MAVTQDDTGRAMLDSVIKAFRSQKQMADRAIQQINFEQMKHQPDPASNSVAVIMKHMAGNMRSRWTDFLTTDGEKDWRHRDDEFVDGYQSRENVEKDWESGWSVLFTTLEKITPADLTLTVTIRDEPHTVFEAIHRQLSHYGYHLGQIVTLCRTLAGDRWVTLTVPRGQSLQHTQKVREAARKAAER